MTNYITRILLTLAAVGMLILPVAAANNVIPSGGDVFIGEQGLNISACAASDSQIAWFAPGTNPATDPPNYLFTVGNATNFSVAPATFVGRTGNWYKAGTTTVALSVVDPSIEIKVWDNNANKDVTGKSVTSGDFLNFRVETNTYLVAQRPTFNPATDGFVTIKVKNPDGAVYTALYQNTTTAIGLTRQVVTSSLWYWGAITPATGWNTGVVDSSGFRLYTAGTYNVSAELNLNGIRDNYKAPGGSDYTGKTVTAFRTVNLVLPAAQGTLYVASYPANATILINGTDRGRTNQFVYNVPAGIRNLTLTLGGYQSYTTVVDVPSGETKILPPITLTKGGGPSADSGTLYVESYPTNATILINGTDRGRTNQFVYNVPAGTRNLTLTLGGYQPYTVLVTVPAGGTKILAPITLTKGGPSPDGTGTLYVASYPTNATILLNGTDRGRTNQFVYNVPAGTRNLTLTRTGYQAKTILINVPAGGTKVLAPITLSPI